MPMSVSKAGIVGVVRSAPFGATGGEAISRPGPVRPHPSRLASAPSQHSGPGVPGCSCFPVTARIHVYEVALCFAPGLARPTCMLLTAAIMSGDPQLKKTKTRVFEADCPVEDRATSVMASCQAFGITGDRSHEWILVRLIKCASYALRLCFKLELKLLPSSPDFQISPKA